MTAANQRSRRQLGVSLIEAIVAMGVMAFGMVGLVGVQAALRGNGDIAKQRAEAVRIAQRTIEDRRAFSVLPVTPNRRAYDDINSRNFNVAGVNATYTVTETVAEVLDNPRRKTVTVQVSWLDRTNVTQAVRVPTVVAGVAPELAGALSVWDATSQARQVRGRHAAIPPGAVNQDGGTSTFTPPGAPAGTSWVFNNTTGLVTRTCVAAVCTTVTGRLLQGFVRFAHELTTVPTAANAASPDSLPLSGVEVVVAVTSPAASVACFEEAVAGPPSYLAYYCLVIADTSGLWSGRSTLAGLALASSSGIADDNLVKVCRYTTNPSNDDALVAPVQSATYYSNWNAAHPYNYTRVSQSLVNQNFLVIRAGFGGVAFACPADDTSTPQDTGTFAHQPAA
jgi:Tfp pilus assembly protein PilV